MREFDVPCKTPPVVEDGDDYRRAITEFISNTQGRIQSNPEAESTKLGMLDVMTRAMDTTQQIITRFHLATYSPDVVIEVPKNVCGFYEFHRARELIDIGYRKAGERLAPCQD